VAGLAVAVQVAHKGVNAALEVEGHPPAVALVLQVDRHAAGDEGHLAEALHQRLEAVGGALFLEDLAVEEECGPGAGALAGRLPTAFTAPVGAPRS